MSGSTAKFWHDIELRIYPDPFSHHVIYIQWIKSLGLKIHWNQGHLSSGFYGCYSRNIIKRFHKWNNFSNCLLIVEAYSKILKLYGMERITTEEVMDKLYFSIYNWKIEEFGWWDLEMIFADAGTRFTSTEFQEKCQTRGVRLALAAPEHQ